MITDEEEMVDCVNKDWQHEMCSELKDKLAHPNDRLNVACNAMEI
jgi:hypothetical protein